MPLYDFQCPSCSETYETFFRMNDKKSKKCEKCDIECQRVYNIAPAAIVDNKKPKTIEDLANKNTERMVKRGELPKSALEFDNHKKKVRAKKERLNKINKMTPKEKFDYVTSGKLK